MPRTKTQKLISLIAICLLAGIASALVLSSNANPSSISSQFDAYMNQNPGHPGASVANQIPDGNRAQIGQKVVAGIGLTGDSGWENQQNNSLIVTYRYPSKFLQYQQIHCAPSASCKQVSWAQLDGNFKITSANPISFGAGNSTPYTDRLLSFCVESRTNPMPTYPISAEFSVINSSDAFLIYATTRIYTGGSCAINDGQSASYIGDWTGGNCLNRNANNKPGNDSYGAPLFCGEGVGSGAAPASQGPPAPSTHGTESGQNGNGGAGAQGTGTAQNRSTSISSSNSSGGSSATRQSNSNANISDSSAQGDAITKQTVNPDPFYDGKQYDAGSEQDNFISSVSSAGSKLFKHWYIAAGVLCVTAAAYLLWCRKRN